MSKETRYTIKRYSIMVVGNLFIGICVACYRLSALGTDAFTCMNLGISQFVHLSFGTWQLTVNIAMLALVFWKARGLIGLGTVVNMVGVGYLADFLCWLAEDVAQMQMTFPMRVVALALGSFFASMGVALYMSAELGAAPYDSLAPILEGMTGGRIPFRWARVACDVTAVAVGVVFCLLAGGNVWLLLGAGTILSALCNGPLIQFFRTHVAEPLMEKQN